MSVMEFYTKPGKTDNLHEQERCEAECGCLFFKLDANKDIN